MLGPFIRRCQRADVWVLIVSDIGNPFFTLVARGVEDVAHSAGYSVVLCNSDEDPSKEARYLEVAERERASGVIISPSAFGSDVSRLLAARIPVVAIDRPLRQPVDSVLVRLRDGVRAATAHLFDEGWQMPACVSGPRRVDAAQQRLAGYRDAVRKRGVLAGRDVGIVAFDSGPWARFMNPPLSVVVQPTYEIGRRAAELLLHRIALRPTIDQHNNDLPTTVTLSTELIVRASSRRRSELAGV